MEEGCLINVIGLLDTSRIDQKSVMMHSRLANVANNILLTDDTGTCTITAWEEWIDFLKSKEKGTVLKICKALVKKFSGEFHLNTCPKTSVEVAEPGTI